MKHWHTPLVNYLTKQGFNVTDIYLLLLLFAVFWYFIYLRKIAEAARDQAIKYCKTEELQYIAIARKYSRPHFSKQQGFFWQSLFELEFSSDGESSYQGLLTLQGLKLKNIELPAYRINDYLH